MMLQHQVDGLDDGCLGANRNHLRRHDLVGTHLSVSRPVAQGAGIAG
jgi:hypothetical protein